MGTADHNLGTLAAIFYIHNKNLDQTVLYQLFAGHLLGLGQHSLILANLQSGIAGDRVYPQHLSRDQLLILALELLHQLAPLRLANALADHMLGSLCDNAAELLGLQRNINGLAHLGALLDGLGLFQSQIRVRVLHFLNHILGHIHLKALLLRVNVAMDNVLAVVVVLGSHHDGGRNFFIQVILRDSLLLRQHLHCIK